MYSRASNHIGKPIRAFLAVFTAPKLYRINSAKNIGIDQAMQTCQETSDSVTELKPGVYRHYKGGKYLVYEVGTHTETNERLVVYRPLYGNFGLSIRPLTMFLESVPGDTSSNETSRPRFQYLAASGSDSLIRPTVEPATNEGEK